ncbi:MAG: TonB family protein [Bacteroidota bacterium]
MRILLLIGLLSGAFVAEAQTTDTTIYTVAEEMPRFPSECERLDTIDLVKNECAQRALLAYISARALYPQEAREANIQGTPVISFIVEKNGLITNPEIVRDPGGGLGSSALRAVQLMQSEVRWRPAVQEGEPVRFKFNLPVRFRLEDPKPYILQGADTVYTDLSSPLAYTGGQEALDEYLETSVSYPEDGMDSCLTGQIIIQLLVHPESGVKVLDLVDYNYLGFEFWYQAIHSAHGTAGQWTAATFEGKAVPTAIDLTYTFLPDNTACLAIASSYANTLEQAREASAAIEAENLDQAIELLTPLIDRFPNDVQLRLLRGQAYLDASRLDEACVDLSTAKEVSGVNWFDAVTRLICP